MVAPNDPKAQFRSSDLISTLAVEALDFLYVEIQGISPLYSQLVRPHKRLLRISEYDIVGVKIALMKK